MDVSINFGRVPIRPDPDVIVTASSAHVAVEISISLSLGATTALVLENLDVVVSRLVLDVDAKRTLAGDSAVVQYAEA